MTTTINFMEEISTAAITYAEQGLPAFPLHPIVDGECACIRAGCTDVGKHPASNGWQRSIASPEAAASIWRPDARVERGIGLALGPRAGAWVSDVDPRHGGDESLARLVAEHGELPATWEAETGDRGGHLYWAWPDDGGEEIRNSTGKIAPGIDVRGAGGFVVAPPSLHASGRRYVWTARPGDRPAPAPGWLVELARAANRTRASASSESSGEEVFARAGERHTQAVSLAGLMRWWGAGEETIVAAVLAFCRTQCDQAGPPALDFAKAEREARDVARRYRPRRGS
jgi:hypothetical protein